MYGSQSKITGLCLMHDAPITDKMKNINIIVFVIFEKSCGLMTLQTSHCAADLGNSAWGWRGGLIKTMLQVLHSICNFAVTFSLDFEGFCFHFTVVWF